MRSIQCLISRLQRQANPPHLYALLCALLLLFLAAHPPVSAAQSLDTGAIEGTIVDPAGLPVRSAHLALRDPANGATQAAISDAGGLFHFNSLAPSTYDLQASAPALALWRSQATVQVGSTTTLHVTLSLATAQQSIEVHDAVAPIIDTTNAALTTVLDPAAVDNLPSSGRRWSNFALLTPGVTPDADASGLLSFRGIGALLNNNTVDGADNNQAFFSEERGRTLVAYSSSQASVSEFQVNVSNYSAEYGRAAGGVINTVTKAGGNQLHGQLFFFDRNNAWAAANAFTNLSTLNPDGTVTLIPVHPRDTLVQGGAAIGGPILPMLPLFKDKLFGFFTIDHYSRNFPAIARATNPSKLFATPTAQQIQTLAQRLNVLPAQALTSYNTVLAGLNSLLGDVPRTAEQNIFFPKLDWQASDRSHLTFSYNRARWNSPNGVQTSPSVTYGTSSFGTTVVKVDTVLGRWAYFLSPNLLNEAHYQYGRDFESQLSGQPATFEQPLARNIYGHPAQVQIQSYGFHFGTPATLERAAYPDERRDELVDSLTWVHGHHTLKTGYEVNYINDYINSLYNAYGTYVYTNALQFAADYLSPNHCDNSSVGVGVLPCYSYFQQGLGPTTFQFQSFDYAGFVSDEWKPFQRLTLSLGLRYEYEQLPNTNAALVNPDIPQTASVPHDKNNYGPRLGFAFDLTGSGRTVLRGGYGIYYGRIINSTVFTALTSTGALNSQRSYYYKPLDTGAPPFPYVFATTPTLTIAPSAAYFDPRFQNPQVHQAELSLEQLILKRTTVTLAYMGSFGRELPNYLDRNIDLSQIGTLTYQVVDPTHGGPLPSTYTTKFFTARLNPKYQQITDIFSETNSKYQAAVIRVIHSLSHNFDLHASFTYSHAADFNQNATAFADTNDVLDPTNLRSEYGNSNYDIRRRLTGGLLIKTPWRLHGALGELANGYSLSTTAEVRDGLPYSMLTGGAVPSTKYIDTVLRTEVLSGLGASINGSGGANRIPEVGRNTYRYSAVKNVDLRISKTTRLSKSVNLELLAETFNLLNHQNATSIDTTGYDISGATSVGALPKLTWQSGTTTGSNEFGTIINSNNTSLYRDREIQLAARLHF